MNDITEVDRIYLRLTKAKKTIVDSIALYEEEEWGTDDIAEMKKALANINEAIATIFNLGVDHDMIDAMLK